MKAFLLSVLTVIASFLGISKSEPPTDSTTSITPGIVETQTSTEVVTITPSSVPTQPLKPKPTIVKLTSSINQEVLKTVFGLQDQQQVDYILNSTEEIKSYQQKYYEKFKNFPVPKITITNPTQHIAMPTKDGFTVCTGQQLQSVYSEIEATEKEIEYEKMDYECHHDPSKQETEECRVWRKENDQNNINPTETQGDVVSKLQQEINEYSNKIKNRQSLYDQLLQKYCSLG